MGRPLRWLDDSESWQMLLDCWREVGNVDRDSDGRTVELGGGLLGGSAIQVGAHHSIAPRRHRLGTRPSDPRTGTRDDGDSAFSGHGRLLWRAAGADPLTRPSG